MEHVSSMGIRPETCAFVSKWLKLYFFLLLLTGNFPPAIPCWVLVLYIAKRAIFCRNWHIRNDLHTFSDKIKIFPLVTLWTDNKIFCPINCSFHCYLSKEVVKLCVQQQEGLCSSYQPWRHLYEKCVKYTLIVVQFVICTFLRKNISKSHMNYFFIRMVNKLVWGWGEIKKLHFFCHKAQNLRTSLGVYKYLKLLEIFAVHLTHEEQPFWSAQQHILLRRGSVYPLAGI